MLNSGIKSITIVYNGILCSKLEQHPCRIVDRWSAIDLENSYICDDEQIIIEKYYQKEIRIKKLKRILK